MKLAQVGRSLLLLLVLGALGCSKKGETGPTGPQGPPGPSVILGFASIDGTATPTVFNFGGGRTTNVTVTRAALGTFDLTFTGSYTGVTGVADITVLATMTDTNGFHVASASMDFGTASATTITARVYVWTTNVTPNTLADQDFAVVVMSSK